MPKIELLSPRLLLPLNFLSPLMAFPVFQLLKVKVTQSFMALCNPMDYTVYGILQARILEWVAIPLSRGSAQPKDQTQVSCIGGGFFTS